MDKIFDVKNKVVCVTGASSGLGQIAANFLVERGAKVVGVARREDRLKEWVEEINGDAAYVTADLTDLSVLEETVASVQEPFGSPDILINAAGINMRQIADHVTPESWDTTLTLNLSIPFFLAQALVPEMRRKKWGRIVNFSSLQSQRAFAGGIAYGASKAGVTQLTRAMAQDWSVDGVMVNALAPGFFPTELTAPLFSDDRKMDELAAQTCIGRNGEPEDMLGPLLFFCSDASQYVTGQTLFVDGGFTAR